MVESWKLLGYENRALPAQAFEDPAADAGEVGAGHSATALHELQLRDVTDGPVASVRLRWQEAEGGEAREISRTIWRSELGRSAEDASPSLRLASVAARFAEALRREGGPEAARLGRLASEARSLAGRPDAAPAVLELAELVEKVRSLAE